METTDLIVRENLDPAKLFLEGKGLTELLDELDTRIAEMPQSVETPADRKEMASNGHKIARSKTFLIGVGNDQVAEAKRKVKATNANIKIVRDHLDAKKTEYRKPLTDWEDAEAMRQAEEEARLARQAEQRQDAMLKLGSVMSYSEALTMTDEAYAVALAGAEAADEARKKAETEEEQRRAAEAEAAQKKLDEERAELDLLKAKQAEAEAKAKAESDAKEAELEAEREKLEAEKEALAEQQRQKDAEERAAKDKADAEAAEKAEAERRAALAPDKEKLIAWLNTVRLEHEAYPEFESERCSDIIDDLINETDAVLGIAIKQAEAL